MSPSEIESYSICGAGFPVLPDSGALTRAGTACAPPSVFSLLRARISGKRRGRTVEHQTGPRRIAHGTRWSNQRGFTVVELMAALLLFSIGLVALARVLPQGMEVRDRGRRMTVAMQLAREQIETLRSLPFTDPDLANGQHVDNQVLRNGTYRRRWTVQDDTPLPNMMRIEVRVAFTTSEADSEAVIVTQRTR